jgi:hypothetical protein
VLGPGVVDVRVEAPDDGRGPKRVDHTGKSPTELFGEYLEIAGVDDERVSRLFADLLDAEVSGAET